MLKIGCAKNQTFLFNFVLGSILSLLGLVVLLGWFINNGMMIHLLPTLGPMPFTTALGFLLLGVGILSETYYPKYSTLMGILVTILGVSNLSQYILSFNINIDELFMREYSPLNTLIPGRMLPNTALCFSLIGICVLFNALNNKQLIFKRIAFMLSIIISIFSIYALLGFFWLISTTKGSGNLITMIPHTSFGFIVVSTSLICSLWKKSNLNKIKNNIMFPVIFFIYGSLLFSFIAYINMLDQKNVIYKNIADQTHIVSSELNAEINNYINSIRRLFLREKHKAYTSNTALQEDAKAYIADVPSIISISRFSNDTISKSQITHILLNKRKILDLNSMCRKLSSKSNTEQFSLFVVRDTQTKKDFLCAYDKNSNVMILLNLLAIFKQVLKHHENLNSFIIIKEKDHILYSNIKKTRITNPMHVTSSHIRIHKQVWTLETIPDEKYIYTQISNTPLYILYIGMLITILMSIVIRYAQIAHHRSLVEKSNAKQVTYLAYHDPLTGVLNRREYEKKIALSIKQANKDQAHMAVLFIDLDRFKHINDSYGHSTGDIFLKSIADMLLSIVKEPHTVCRIGGDEFGLVLHQIKKPEDAEHMADIIISEFIDSVAKNNKYLGVTASIGIATFPDEGQTVSDLIKSSDIALHKAKGDGKNTYKRFNKTYDMRSKYLIQLEALLYQALDKDEFHLVFQPIYDTSTNSIIGLETLTRWNSPIMGDVSPDDFIPIAEQTHLIIVIGRWILKKSIESFHTLYRSNPNLKLSINLSPKELTDDSWFQYVMTLLNQYAIPLSSIIFELTETDIIQDIGNTRKKLKILVEAGFNVYIDDFGTGYSSLQLLLDTSVTGLKIDKSFVSALNNGDKEGKMIRSIISLAEIHGLTIVAEGVETKEQFEFLKQHRCAYVQGYYLSRPVSIDEIKKRLDDST